MHMKYWVNITCLFEKAAILVNFLNVALLFMWLSLRALIFGTVIHLYWGYPQERNCASIDNIIKVKNFLKISHFAIFD